jgi:hypothetical protein
MSGSHFDQHPYLYDEDFDMGAKELAHDVFDDEQRQQEDALFPWLADDSMADDCSLDWSEPLFIDDDDELDLLEWDEDALEGETDF